MLNKRQSSILEILKHRNDYITGKDLSELFKVSDRTIRNDILNINYVYGGVIIADKRKGYKLSEDWISDEEKTNVHVSKQERLDSILRKLLLAKNNSIWIEKLSEELYISSYSIQKDIKLLNERVSCFTSLLIERKQNRLVLIGENKDKKNLLNHLIKKEAKGNFANITSISKLFDEFDLNYLKNRLLMILSKNNYQVRIEYMPMIMIHIGVTISLAISHKEEKSSIEDYAPQSIEESIMLQYFAAIKNEISMEVSISDIKEISLLLKAVQLDKKALENQNENVIIQDIVEAIIQDIFASYGIDFREDRLFVDSLTLHLNALFKRTKENNRIIKNIYLSDIKNKFPLLFDMAVASKKIIDYYMDTSISEDEIGFLCLHLGAAYDRNIQKDKYRAILISPLGVSATENCVTKINSQFGTKLNIIDVFAYLDEVNYNKQNLDMILTTIPLEVTKNIQIPIVEISIFFTKEDEFLIYKTLLDLDEKWNDFLVRAFKEKYFKEELFYNFISCEDPNEIIKIMVDDLIKFGYVNDISYYDNIIEREQAASTSFKNGFALPHAGNFSAIKTGVSIAILDKPIKWGAYWVSVVILLTVSEQNKDVFGFFVEHIGKLFRDPQTSAQLINANSYSEFLKYL